MEQPTCKTCRWWAQHAPNEVTETDTGRVFLAHGCCHRHAPRPTLTSDEDDRDTDAMWPVTTEGDWCGEHKPHEATAAAFTKEGA